MAEEPRAVAILVIRVFISELMANDGLVIIVAARSMVDEAVLQCLVEGSLGSNVLVHLLF